MSEDATKCTACGAASRDPEWCDTCGARLSAPGAQTWLESGSKLTVLDAAERELSVHVTECVDTFQTRRVLFAEVLNETGAPMGRRLLLEERETGDGEDLENRIPEVLKTLFRTPFAIGRNGDHSVRCYVDSGAVTLEDLLDLSGELSYQQIKEVFLAILDAVIAAHEAKHLILAIAPWTIRLENARIPQLAGDETYVEGAGARREDVTIEHKRPDKAALAGAISETDSQPEEEEEEAAPGSREDSIFDAPESKPSLSGRTMPLHRPPADVLAAAKSHLEEDDDDDDDEYVSAPEEEDMDVDDLWDSLDDESDGMEETGILHGANAGLGPKTEAFFEGIDELYSMDGEPYEVPVIMGFSPPELLGRVRADLGPHCDVFALGMLLYFMISGRVPPASVYTRYTPAIPVRNFRPGFPPGLQPVVGRATRPTPGDRFQSVAALRDEFIAACSTMEQRAATVGTGDITRAVIAVDTHVGIAKGRRNPINQDSVFGRVSDDGRFALIVVADGVSTASYGTGDLASNHLTAAAVEVWDDALPKYLLDERVEEVEVITAILEKANENIVKYVNGQFTPFDGNPHEVMGTTGLLAVIRDGIVTLASLGDSRVYLQTSNGLEQITADHNLWTLSVLDGISADAALSMPHGDALARCLGTFIIENRKLVPVRPEADYFRFAVSKGDTLLMTTDGLVDFGGPNPFAAEENILAAMLAEPDPALACLELILLANRGGGGDNIGVGIIHFI